MKPQLSCLEHSHIIQDSAARVGFDWDNADDILAKLHEEVAEIVDACSQDDHAAIHDELGDAFFTLVNLARHYGMDANSIVAAANTKFNARFTEMERAAAEDGSQLANESLAQMEARWHAAKHTIALR